MRGVPRLPKLVWLALIVAVIALLWGEPQVLVNKGPCVVPGAYACQYYQECDYKGFLSGYHRFIPDTGHACALIRMEPFRHYYPAVEYGYGPHLKDQLTPK